MNTNSPNESLHAENSRLASRAQFGINLFSSAVADAILPIFYIFIPLFAVKLGANALELGLVGGSAYAVYSFMPFIMGHFSDRRGSRKFFILFSFLLLGVVSFLYSISNSPTILIITRIFEGTGWAMLWPAMEAAVTGDPERDSKKSLSVFNFTWSAGASLGPPIGTFLVTVFSYRSAFFASGLLFVGLIALNGALLLRSEPSPRKVVGPIQKDHVSLSSSIRRVLLTKDKKKDLQVWTCIASITLAALTSAVFFTFFGPYANSLGISLVLIGAATTVYGAIRFFTYVALARGSIRTLVYNSEKRIRNVLGFLALASLSTLILMIKDHSAILYFVSFALFAIGYSVVYSISQGPLIVEAKPEQMGTGAGVFESSIGLGGFVGPIIAGYISTRSLVVSFLVPPAGLVFVLALLSVLFLGSRSRPKEAS